MEYTIYLTTGLVLGGAILLLLAMAQTHKIFKLLNKIKFRRNWRNLFILMAFFFLGYLGVIYIIYIDKVSLLQILTGVIFFFGAVFVFLVVLTGSGTFKMLHEANEKLEEKINLLKTQNDLLTQFNYATSHDLKEPVNTVIGCVSMLKEDYADKLDEKGVKFINYSVQAADRMSELITGLSDYLKIGHEKKNEETDLNILMNEVIGEMQGSIQGSNAKIELGQLPTLPVNGTDIKRVFQNLISNALKYKKKGIDPQITISATKVPKRWIFEIKDNGIGINAAIQDKAFQIFRQLHQKNKYEGMGIGLAICKKIIELHGGTIWLESKEGQGTSFFFTLKRL